MKPGAWQIKVFNPGGGLPFFWTGLPFFWTTPRNKNFDFLWAHFLEKAFPWHAPLKLWNCLSRVCGGYVFEVQIRLGRSLLFRASIFRKRGATERTAVQKQRRTKPRTKMEIKNFGLAFVRNGYRRHRRANESYICIYWLQHFSRFSRKVWRIKMRHEKVPKVDLSRFNVFSINKRTLRLETGRMENQSF